MRRAQRLAALARLSIERRAVLIEALAQIPGTSLEECDADLIRGLAACLARVADLLADSG